MKRTSILVLLLTAAFAVSAETFTWTGAQNTLWTNAANWSVSGVTATRAPGAVMTAEDPGGWTAWETENDTAVFTGPALGGSANDVTINMRGLCSISNLVFRGADIPHYTLGVNSSDTLRVRQGGRVEVMADCAQYPTFSNGNGVGYSWGTTVACGYIADQDPNHGKVTFVNNAEGQFDIGNVGYPKMSASKDGTTRYIDYTFEGTGGFKIGQFNMNSPGGFTRVYLRQKGRFTLTGSTTTSFEKLYLEPPADGVKELEIVSGAQLALCNLWGNGLFATDSYRIFGDGTLAVSGRSTAASATPNNFATRTDVANGCTLTIETRVAHSYNADEFAISADNAAKCGDIVLTAQVTNSISGGVSFYSSRRLTTPIVDALGADGPLGSGPLRMSNRGTLVYTGAGETTTRALSVANLYFIGSGRYDAFGSIVYTGSGKWTIASTVTATGSDYSTVTSTDGTLSFSTPNGGEIEFTGAFADGTGADGNAAKLNVTEGGTGTFRHSAASTYSGTTSITGVTTVVSAAGTLGTSAVTLYNGATLVFEGGASPVAKTLAALTTGSGANTLAVSNGVTLTLAAAPTTAGGTVDVRLASGAKAVISAWAGQNAPDWFTVNGVSGKIGPDGTVAEKTGYDTTTTIPAKGGVVPDDAAAVVGIDREGTTGPITLEKATTTVDLLVQQTQTDATVSLGGGTLAAKGFAVEKAASNLTVGVTAADGTVSAVGSSFMLDNVSTSSKLRIVAPLSVPTSTVISKQGAGEAEVNLSGAWAGTAETSAGPLVFNDAAGTTLATTLSGVGTFTKAGASAWTLSKAQGSFTGTFAVRGGSALGSAATFGAGDLRAEETGTLTAQLKVTDYQAHADSFRSLAAKDAGSTAVVEVQGMSSDTRSRMSVTGRSPETSAEGIFRKLGSGWVSLAYPDSVLAGSVELNGGFIEADGANWPANDFLAFAGKTRSAADFSTVAINTTAATNQFYELSLETAAKGMPLGKSGAGTVQVTGTAAEPLDRFVSYEGLMQLSGVQAVCRDLLSAATLTEARPQVLIDEGADLEVTNSVRVGSTGCFVGFCRGGVATLTVSNATLRHALVPSATVFGNNSADRLWVGTGHGSGILRVEEGAVITNKLIVGDDNAADGIGVAYQRGGTVVSQGADPNVSSEGRTCIGFASGFGSHLAYGYYDLAGGTFTSINAMGIGWHGSCGVMDVHGGVLSITNHPVNGREGAAQLGLSSTVSHPTGVSEGWANHADGVLLVRAGAQLNGVGQLIVGAGKGMGTFTVSGKGTRAAFKGGIGYCQTATDDALGGIVNVSDGATLSVSSYISLGQSRDKYFVDGVWTRAPAYFNADGGILELKDIAQYQPAFLQLPKRITVFAGGFTVSCVDSIYPSLTGDILPAPGKGIASVPWTPLAGQLAAPFVRIRGDGEGASAVGVFNPETGTITSIRVTSPGWNYTWAKADVWIGRTKIGDGIDCTLADNAEGSFTKTGASDLWLAGTNHLTRTVIREGKLRLRTDGALTTNAVVRLEGGTLDFDQQQTTPIASIEGTSGTVLNAGKNRALVCPGAGDASGISFGTTALDFTGDWTVDAAELDPSVPYAKYDANVTFAQTARVIVDQPELLDPEVESYPLFTVAAGKTLTGKPVLAPAELQTKWRLRLRDNTLWLVPRKGLMLIVR